MIRASMTRPLFRCALLLLLMAGGSAAGLAQTADPSPCPSPAPEPDFIVPARPTVSNPAEFQKPGVLQLELGFNRNLHATEDSSPWDFPLALRFAVSRRLLVEFDGDSPFAQESGGMRVTGAGDSQLGVQLVLQHERCASPGPGISFAYYIKVPTANSRRGLGTGRVDHNFIVLLSKTYGKNGKLTLDVNGTWLLAGRTSNQGHASSAQAAAALSYQITQRWALQAELSGFGRNDQQSGAMSTLAAVTYQASHRFVIDGGVRAGLTHDAPGLVAFVGMTVGVADLYRHHHHSPN
jgi:hypothetical protein